MEIKIEYIAVDNLKPYAKTTKSTRILMLKKSQNLLKNMK